MESKFTNRQKNKIKERDDFLEIVVHLDVIMVSRMESPVSRGQRKNQAIL